MLWIGITGGIGTGKSTFSKALRQRSYVVFDADEISRALTQKGAPAYGEVVEAFGAKILNDSNEIDRKKLGEIVFKDLNKLKKLEQIIHPKIQKKIKEEKKKLEDQGVKMAFYDVPLLYENNLQDNFDKVIVVYCDFRTQLERAVKRTGLSEEEITDRINNQIFLDEKVNQCNFPINNNGSLEDLENQVEVFLDQITN